MAKKTIKEATLDDERLLKSVTNNEADTVMVRGKKFRVKWMHAGTADWISSLMVQENNDNKVLAQSAALIALNGFWKTHLFYWFVWRWYYYVRQYNAGELTPLFELAQKKTQQQVATAYLTATMLLTAMKDTKKIMTRAEAERSLRELRSGNDGKSPRSTESTQGRSESSASQ